jgi:hypothetical protein
LDKCFTTPGTDVNAIKIKSEIVIIGIRRPTNNSGATTARSSSQPAVVIKSASHDVINELVITSLMMAIDFSQMK